jgi:ribosomal protein L31E
LPTINTKSAASEVLSWKKSQKVKDVLRKLNQDIDGHENLTWCTKIMEKIWEKSRKVSKEKVAFTISIIQYLLSPKVESIKIDDEAIRKRMKKNIVSINLLNLFVIIRIIRNTNYYFYL